jgi:hypothetical protein
MSRTCDLRTRDYDSGKGWNIGQQWIDNFSVMLGVLHTEFEVNLYA